MTKRVRILLVLLALVIAGVMALVTAIQIWGQPLGGPCADSYSCKGFLIGGAECLAEGSTQYCTRYCEYDAQCPPRWSCGEANPTVLTIETLYWDRVCVRPSPD